MRKKKQRVSRRQWRREVVCDGCGWKGMCPRASDDEDIRPCPCGSETCVYANP